MMRYFFDVRSEQLETLDEEGVELENEQQMQREARRLLAQIAEDESRFQTASVLMARVRDQSGQPVYRAVLTLEGQRLQ